MGKDIITYDAGFAARLSGHATVKALYLEEYMVTKRSSISWLFFSSADVSVTTTLSPRRNWSFCRDVSPNLSQ